MGRLSASLRLAGFVALTLPLMPVQQILCWLWPAGARHLPHLYHRAVAAILGFRIDLHGRLPRRGPALLVSNHVSWIDIVVLSALAPCSFIAKREVAGWPFFGRLAKLQRTVFVDRDRRQSTGTSRDSIAARLKSGDTLVLFPEGTSSDGHRVLPFRSAYFGAADDPAVPVIPVTLAYSLQRGLPMGRRNRPFFAWYGDMTLPRHLWAALRKTPITITVVVHPALGAATRSNRKALSWSAEGQVRQGLVEALHGGPKTR